MNDFWKNFIYHMKRCIGLSALFSAIFYFTEGTSVALLVFIVCFGCYKLGVVAQMVYENNSEIEIPENCHELHKDWMKLYNFCPECGVDVRKVES